MVFGGDTPPGIRDGAGTEVGNGAVGRDCEPGGEPVGEPVGEPEGEEDESTIPSTPPTIASTMTIALITKAVR